MSIRKNINRMVNEGRAALAADKARKLDAGRRNAYVMAAVALCTVGLMPEAAWAAPWDTMGTQVIAIFTGGLTRSIAILAVIGCGIAAAAGKLQWSWAISIVFGIVLIFGSAAIVDYFIAAAS